jgi:hypothetical protein
MNHLVIEGEFKNWILGKPKSFELHIYYTPLKGTIVDVKFYSNEDITIDSIKSDFRIGDNIEVARTWIDKNKYKVTTDFTRI